LVSPTNDCRFADQEMMGQKALMLKRQFIPLAKILRALKLDETQKVQVKGFVVDFRLCIKDAILTLRQTEIEILTPFNQERKQIYTDFKAGLITREDAVAQLKVIAQNARQALKDNNARIIACEAMKECRRLLLEKIRGILNADQLTKWDEWIAKLPVKDCAK
jgi:hypothetical protein